jgi:sugar phosphate isomerase/epimerase
LPAGARALGLGAIEANDFMLPPPRLSRAGLARLQTLAAEQGTELLAWTINSDFTVPVWQWPAQRLYLARGLAAARQCGASLLRVNLGGSVETAATRDALIANRLAAFVRRSQGTGSGPAITLENHWGVSSDIDRHLRIFDAARAQLAAGERGRLGCCFDPSNMSVAEGAAAEAQRERWWEALAERANHFHLKTAAFDETGWETTLPHERLWALLEAAGYNGAVTIEFQGEGDPAAGVRQSVALFHRLAGR